MHFGNTGQNLKTYNKARQIKNNSSAAQTTVIYQKTLNSLMGSAFIFIVTANITSSRQDDSCQTLFYRLSLLVFHTLIKIDMSKVIISAAGNASQTPVTPKSLDNKNAIAEIDTIPLDNAITEDSTPFPVAL